MSETVRRADLVDVLVRDGESLVLTENRCLRLTEVATAAVQILERPKERATLETMLVARFGPAPDGALDELVTELVDVGVLTWDD
jgi:hypothetical protein